MSQQWILNWNSAVPAGPRVCGGKGWNLGRLHRYGFPVPPGGVLVADAYARFISNPALAPLLADLAEVPPDEVGTPEVVRRLVDLQKTIQTTELPDDVIEAVRDFLEQTELIIVPVAVRSSATAEDSAALSFAGIHGSTLNVVGLDQVLQAIRKCYASLWTPQALAYRRHWHLRDENVSCAVVLCAMISGPEGVPVASGVAFSCDPRTGRRDQVTISAGPGLGEGVVNGQTVTEEITLVSIMGRLQFDSRQGRPDQVLTEEQALELGRLVLRAHWDLGDGQNPKDVEWAYDGRRFWVLQARPVTRVPRASWPETVNMPVIWTNANLKEVIPGVATPMAWNLLQVVIRDIWFTPVKNAGYAVPSGMEIVRRFRGRMYFDFTAIQWVFYDCFGQLPRDTNRTHGGHQPEIPLPAVKSQGKRGFWARLGSTLNLVRLLFPFGQSLPKEITQVQAEARRLKKQDLTRLTPGQLLDVFYHMSDVWSFGHRFMMANANASAWQGVLERTLTWIAPERGSSLAAALMAGSRQVTSAEQSLRLHDLADAARQDPAALTYLQTTPRDPQGWRTLSSHSPFRQALEIFLADFGHRAVYEMEIANPRWNEDPTFLLDQICYLLDANKEPSRNAQDLRAAAEKELARHTRLFLPMVRWLTERARQGAALREDSKSTLVALGEGFRYLLLEVGSRLATSGAIADRADIFYLTLAEVESYLKGEWDGTGAKALVADQKNRAATWAAKEPPDVLILDAEGTMQKPATPGKTVSPNHQGNILTGLGVTAGSAAGPARVLRHPHEGHRLQAGDVLVAPSTDPGWTPLFLRARALVLEMGGYLSHGAIVAREFGIPAVVNIPGLLQKVQDGQQLLVDADAGRVVVNDATPPSAFPQDAQPPATRTAKKPEVLAATYSGRTFGGNG